MDSFAKRLNKALEKADVTPAELSRLTGIPEGTISHYRSGMYEPKQRRLHSIASALKTTPAYLMGWEDEHGGIDVVSTEVAPIKKTGLPYDKASAIVEGLINPNESALQIVSRDGKTEVIKLTPEQAEAVKAIIEASGMIKKTDDTSKL